MLSATTMRRTSRTASAGADSGWFAGVPSDTWISIAGMILRSSRLATRTRSDRQQARQAELVDGGVDVGFGPVAEYRLHVSGRSALVDGRGQQRLALVFPAGTHLAHHRSDGFVSAPNGRQRGGEFARRVG